ncbi:MAG: hypothetical protein HFH68_01480 [Lachnospiraceae bacterium]|nr:hypothetical protein [Lachnospiraceae bacterium]
MGTVQLLTVQNKHTKELLCKNQIYRNIGTYTKPNHVQPFKDLMSAYGYQYSPVFCLIVGLNGNCYGIPNRDTDLFLLELHIIEKYVRYQDYYNWTDIIYYSEYKSEWNEPYSFEKYEHNVFHYYKSIAHINTIRPIQATLPFIEPSWLKNYILLPGNYTKQHDGHINLVKPFKDYL